VPNLKTDSIFLYGGNIVVNCEKKILRTVLGSCVAVCLYDPEKALGGMNHYLLPLWNGEGLPTPKFGNIAIEQLVELMTSSRYGCRHCDLQAKIFGGASIMGDRSAGHNVSQRNVNIAFNALAKTGIEIINSDVGGNQARQLHFYTHSGDVYMKRVTKG